jgi:nicotinamide-nucleotide amidase
VTEGGADASAELVARLATERGWSVGTAESLTSGAVASALGAAPDASSWFRGGVVAYSSEVKRNLLYVDPGPVVSARCAQQMARAAAALLGAHAAVSTTGAGGPDPQDDQPVGTVFIAVYTPQGEVVAEHHFDGPPEAVVEQTLDRALALLAEQLAF